MRARASRRCFAPLGLGILFDWPPGAMPRAVSSGPVGAVIEAHAASVMMRTFTDEVPTPQPGPIRTGQNAPTGRNEKARGKRGTSTAPGARPKEFQKPPTGRNPRVTGTRGKPPSHLLWMCLAGKGGPSRRSQRCGPLLCERDPRNNRKCAGPLNHRPLGA